MATVSGYPNGRGKLIVIEGTDGSGKATQAELLISSLKERQLRTEYMDFPQYGKKSAGPVENYLSGAYGTAGAVDPRIASIFYAMDRYDASFRIRELLRNDTIVVCNRYTSANMGHQGGKIDDEKERREYIEWLEDFEFNFLRIPRPDMTILLYVPYQIAQGLIDNRGRARDIHENDEDHIRNAEAAYLAIAREKGWKIINCTLDGKMLPIGEIQKSVWGQLRELGIE